MKPTRQPFFASWQFAAGAATGIVLIAFVFVLLMLLRT